MPTYEYKCTECGEHFEIQQSMSEDALTSLEGPDHEHSLKKVFAPPGIAFRGTGFYKNDARSDSSKSTSSSSADKPATKVDSTKSSDSSSSAKPKKEKKEKASTKSAKSSD